MTAADAKGADFAALASGLWARRIWILAGTAIGIAIGLVLAFTAKPVYKSWAVIVPKESQGANVGQGLLSQLGGIGNIVASQFGGGQMSMDRMETMLQSRDLAESLLVRNDLLPLLYPDRWDSSAKAWKSGVKVPSMFDGIEHLSRDVIYSNLDLKKKVLEVGALAPDSGFSARLAGMLLECLNHNIKSMIETEAEANRVYLENQLARSADPLLQEKIQQLIAMEIEKSMLVGSQSFYVIQSPFVPKFRSAPNRKKILAVAALLGFMLSVGGAAAANALAGARPAASGAKGA